ncbi:M64 family metallopeptidase [Actinoplanes sp. NPDC049265]|uniref:M64 family metallopeptidase n=1 Tax=Actinoplanes sp. NPDC049265 TaxID=3363902 RepID=UPI00371605F4
MLTIPPAALALLLLLAPQPAPAQVDFEVFAPDGTISRTTVPAGELPRVSPKAAPVAEVVTIQQTGAPADRFDLVFVGDGYTASEQALFHSQAVARWAQITAYEPFKTLKVKFNVWQVNAVSNQSGADNDPTPGVRKDTALGGRFYCDNLARLICVDTSAARSYAALAPGLDQALVLVNSTTYGGSGGTVTVSSGGNSLSGDIVVHELGHSIGGLADEYGGPGAYSGGEPREPNTSLLTAAQMQAQNRKWASYLGRSTPDGGVIGTFEGGAYFDKGVYRPSQNSMMRNLGRQFNLIGVDKLTAAINARTH